MRAAVLLFLLLAVCHARKGRSSHRHGDLRSHQVSHAEEQDLMNQLAKKDEHPEWCHRAALSKCGATFLRASKLLSYLLDSDLVAFRTRCGLRSAFFECLKLTRERVCHSRHHPPPRTDPDFRKRLTDALWSTRVCVLGLHSFAKH